MPLVLDHGLVYNEWPTMAGRLTLALSLSFAYCYLTIACMRQELSVHVPWGLVHPHRGALFAGAMVA